MKLAVMQPYFFPYIGYFSLIKNTDKWIVFDTAQFIRHGWIDRNRILKPSEGWQYIRVPLEKFTQQTPIKDVKIKNDTDWKDQILRQLIHYKKRAPYYKQVIHLLNDLFSHNTDDLTSLNVFLLSGVCEYLKIDFNYRIFSQMNLNIENVKEPDEWALNISKALNAKCYINPPNGINFFNKEKYSKNGIDLKFLKVNIAEYNQYRENFEGGLSVIDVMMFNSPQLINRMLDKFEYIEV